MRIYVLEFSAENKLPRSKGNIPGLHSESTYDKGRRFITVLCDEISQNKPGEHHTSGQLY